jgi:hypothetical protein
MPSLVSCLLSLTRAQPSTLFLNLGSGPGVGSVVLYAALRSGCSAFGVKVMENPVAIAREQHTHLMMRAPMKEVNKGNIELDHANMCENARA